MRILCESIFPSRQISRCVTSCFDISSVKKAQGVPVRTTLAAMLIPRALFPIEGRAARMIRLPGWKPAVTASSSEKPLEMPVTDAPCS